MRGVAEIVDVIRDVSGVKWNSDVEELLGLHSGVLANLKKHRRMESFMTPLMEYCSNRGFNLQWFLTGEGDIYAEESKQYVWEPERFGPIQTRLRELENSEDEFTTLAHKLGLDFKAVDDEFGISRGDLEKYANKKGVRLQWILKGTGEKNLKRKIKFADNLGNIQIGKSWRTTSEEANKNRSTLLLIKKRYAGTPLEQFADRALIKLSKNKKPVWMKDLTQYWDSGDVDPRKLISYFPFKRWEVEEDKQIPIKDKKVHSHNTKIEYLKRNSGSEPVDDSVKDELIASMKRELELLWRDNMRLASELEEFKEIGKKDL